MMNISNRWESHTCSWSNSINI